MDEESRSDADSTAETGLEVQDGEVVESMATEDNGSQATEDNGSQATEDNGSQATILESLTGLIRDNLAKEKKLKEEANKAKEMIDSVLTNDETYKQHDEAAKQ